MQLTNQVLSKSHELFLRKSQKLYNRLDIYLIKLHLGLVFSEVIVRSEEAPNLSIACM